LYDGIIGSHIVPLLGKIMGKNVTRKDVARLPHDLRNAPHMVNRTVAALSKFFNWCEKNGY
jgi:hypothetical protein